MGHDRRLSLHLSGASLLLLFLLVLGLGRVLKGCIDATALHLKVGGEARLKVNADTGTEPLQQVLLY